MPRYLLADIGSTFTKLCAVDTDAGAIIAQATAPTTVAGDGRPGIRGCPAQA